MRKYPVNDTTYGEILSLSTHVRLRREYFGGLAFNITSGDIVEMDKEAFALLMVLEWGKINRDELKALLVRNNVVRWTDPLFEKILKEFLDSEIICHEKITKSIFSRESDIPPLSGNPPEAILNPATYQFPEETFPRQWLSAPETVHWAITYRCSKNCPECYAMRFRQDGHELSLDASLKVVDRLAGWGVFQLALGGGEPFEKDGLQEIASHAAASGLVVHITTGRKDLNYGDIASYAGKVKTLQVGFSTQELSGDFIHGMKGNLSNAIHALKDAGISPGANIILSKAVIRNLEPLIEGIVSAGFERIVFIRYKPPASENLWRKERPDRGQLFSLHRKIISVKKRCPGLNLRMDCALSFLQRNMPASIAEYAGLKGCVAGDRILALSPDGGMYPCSQLVSVDMKVGNIIQDDPQEIWDNSKILKRYRNFRSGKALKESWCGYCTRKDTCGGCRIFAHDALGGDPGCPEPVLVLTRQMDKEGRFLDIKEYLKIEGGITAWEYMERYGVGEKKAIRELNMLTGLTNRSPKFRYTDPRDDIIASIQDSIGHTSGGVPFTSYDQVSEWIEEGTDDYPQWIYKDHDNRNQ